MLESGDEDLISHVPITPALLYQLLHDDDDDHQQPARFSSVNHPPPPSASEKFKTEIFDSHSATNPPSGSSAQLTPSATPSRAPLTFAEELARVLAETEDEPDIPTATSWNLSADDHLMSTLRRTAPVPTLKRAKSALLQPTHANQSQQHAQQEPEVADNIVLVAPVGAVSEVLLSDLARRNAGLPTCVAMEGSTLAVGTSHGVTLIFDAPAEELRLLLAAPACHEYGPVTCLALHAPLPVPPNAGSAQAAGASHAGEQLLLAGHARGHVLLWGLWSGRPIRVLPPLSLQGSPPAVCSVAVLDGARMAALDSRGELQALVARKGLLDGRGELQPLRLTDLLPPGALLAAQYVRGAVPHAFDHSLPLAVAISPSVVASGREAGLRHEVLLCTLAAPTAPPPALVVRARLAQEPPATEAPVRPGLAWSRASALRPPLLAVAWGSRLSIYTLQSAQGAGSGDWQMARVWSEVLDCEAVACEWLANGHVLVVLTATEQLRILDPPLKSLSDVAADDFDTPAPASAPNIFSEVERLPVRSLELVFTSRFGPRPAFCHSLRAAPDGRLYALGLRNLYSASVLTWRERCDLLAGKRAWNEALNLARQFYQGDARAAVGLPAAADARKVLVGEYTRGLLRGLLDDALAALGPPPLSQAAREKLGITAATCVEYACAIGAARDVLAELSEAFEPRGAREVLLESLEKFVRRGVLTAMPPALLPALLAYHHSRGTSNLAEECVLHLDLTKVDLPALAATCRQLRLHAALIHIYTRGMDDYLTPLKELMGQLLGQPPLPHKERTRLCEQLLAFLSNTLRGRAAAAPAPAAALSNAGTPAPPPSARGNDMPRTKMAQVRARVLGYLFDPPAAPPVRALLQLDPRAGFAMLHHAFADTPEVDAKVASPSPAHMLQVLCQLLLPQGAAAAAAAMTGLGANNANANSTNLLVASELFVFMAREFVAGHVELPDDLFTAMMAALLARGSDSLSNTLAPAIARQEALVGLLEKCPKEKYQEDRILLQAEEVGFYSVAELLHRRRRNHIALLKTYLKDPQRSTGIFALVRQLMADQSLSEEQRQAIRNFTLQSLTSLIKIDPAAAALLMIEVFPQDNERVLKELGRTHRELQYIYLKSIMEQSGKPPTEALGADKAVAVTSEMHEMYIELMCTFAPSEVYPYLVAHDDYRLEHCLALVKNAGVKLIDASAYLLERTGDVSTALSLLLTSLDDRLAALKRFYENPQAPPPSPRNSKAAPEIALSAPAPPPAGPPSANKPQPGSGAFPSEKAEVAVMESLNVAIALCQRSSQRLEHAERDALWFKLLDRLVIPLRRLKVRGHLGGGAGERGGVRMHTEEADAKRSPAEVQADLMQERIKYALTHFIHHVLYNMMGYISLPSILDKIVRDHGSDEFGDFKSIFISMLDNYRYEQTILKTATKLIQQDMHTTTSHLRAVRLKPLSPRVLPADSGLQQQPLCGVCARSFQDAHFSAALAAHTAEDPAAVAAAAAAAGAPASPHASLGDEEARAPGRQIARGGGVVVFRCGHVYHATCLGRGTRCPLCATKKQEKKALANMKHSLQKQAEEKAQIVPPAVGLGLEKRARSQPLEPTETYLQRLEGLARRQANEPSRLGILGGAAPMPLLDPRRVSVQQPDLMGYTRAPAGAGVSAVDGRSRSNLAPGGGGGATVTPAPAALTSAVDGRSRSNVPVAAAASAGPATSAIDGRTRSGNPQVATGTGVVRSNRRDTRAAIGMRPTNAPPVAKNPDRDG